MALNKILWLSTTLTDGKQVTGNLKYTTAGKSIKVDRINLLRLVSYWNRFKTHHAINHLRYLNRLFCGKIETSGCFF